MNTVARFDATAIEPSFGRFGPWVPAPAGMTHKIARAARESLQLVAAASRRVRWSSWLK